jgi:hypothetical protein
VPAGAAEGELTRPRDASHAGFFSNEVPSGRKGYFSEVLIDVNWVLRFEPRPFTTAIIASAMPAAIRPYSIAVAPDSSDRNFKK